MDGWRERVKLSAQEKTLNRKTDGEVNDPHNNKTTDL